MRTNGTPTAAMRQASESHANSSRSVSHPKPWQQEAYLSIAIQKETSDALLLITTRHNSDSHRDLYPESQRLLRGFCSSLHALCRSRQSGRSYGFAALQSNEM